MMAGDDFEFRKRRIAGEVLVGKDLQILRMVDGQKAHLVDVNDFFERLHETKTQETMALADVLAFYLDIFRRIGNVAFARPDPMTHHARADHVRHKTVAAAVPNEEYRTRAAAAVHL